LKQNRWRDLFVRSIRLFSLGFLRLDRRLFRLVQKPVDRVPEFGRPNCVADVELSFVLPETWQCEIAGRLEQSCKTREKQFRRWGASSCKPVRSPNYFDGLWIRLSQPNLFRLLKSVKRFEADFAMIFTSKFWTLEIKNNPCAKNSASTIFNHMVKRHTQSLDRTFAALADPTRRRILARLARGERCVTDLARPYSMSFAGGVEAFALCWKTRV